MAQGVLFNVLEDNLLNHEFRGIPYVQPPNLFFDASTTTPAENGSNITLPPGAAGYAGITFNTWNAAASRKSTNNGDMVFPTPTAPWGTITHIVCRKDNAVGELMFFFDLSPAEVVDVGNPLVILDGDVTIEVATSAVDGLSSYGDSLANQTLDHILKNTVRVGTTAHFVEWSSTAFNDDGTGGTPPPTIAGRATVGAWNAPTNSVIDNFAAFQSAVASGDTPLLTHVALHDSASGGLFLAHGPVDVAKIVLNAQVARYNAAGFNLTMT